MHGALGKCKSFAWLSVLRVRGCCIDPGELVLGVRRIRSYFEGVRKLFDCGRNILVQVIGMGQSKVEIRIFGLFLKKLLKLSNGAAKVTLLHETDTYHETGIELLGIQFNGLLVFLKRIVSFVF